MKIQNDRKYPSIETAEALLAAASITNPGRWIDHSRVTANACQQIAKACGDMDTEKAYILGLLHDIGRRDGVMQERHLINGYRFCMAHGWDDCAKICITHSFVLRDIDCTMGIWDAAEEDLDFVKSFIQSVPYDNYDLLLQLTDNLALPEGYCIIEKRIVDVIRRYGVNHLAQARIQAIFSVKEQFDRKVGGSIYDFLPGILDTVFE